MQVCRKLERMPLKNKIEILSFSVQNVFFDLKKMKLADRSCCKGCPRKKTYRGDIFNQLQNWHYPFKNSHLALPL